MRRLSLPQSLRLVPIHHLHRIGATDGGETWEMTGNDPQFLLQGKRSGYRPGTYRLSVKLGAPASLTEPKLYLDEGEGHREAATVPLIQSGNGRRLSATFELRSPTAGFRFDPSQETGQIFIESVQLRRVSTTGLHLNRLARALYRRVRSPRDAATLARRSLALYREGGFPALRQAVVREVGKHDVGTGDNSYARWIRLYDTLTPESLTVMRTEAKALPRKPLISVVMPVYNTPEKLLREAIESVQAQVYPHWEFCIADDASTAPHVRRILKEYARADRRIKVVFRGENGHISRASNSALELATGEWIALLDHDDVLRPHALLEVVRTINRYPDAELIYSDEDKIDETGRRFDAFFKPDFSLEMFRSQNYLNHLTVHRTANVRAVGGWRTGFEGSQDYDLNLRIIERVEPRHILHIPKILYHWRAVSGSTAAGGSEKSYAWEAGRRALEAHVERVRLAASVEEVAGTPFYRLRLSAPAPEPLVSLIVPTRDGLKFLRGCIESIREKTTYANYEIIVVDNGSTDPETLKYLKTISRRRNMRVLRYDAPFNFSAINNFAVGKAKGSVIGLINNDIEVISPEWLTEMVSWALQPGVGCVGAKLFYENETIQHAGVIVGLGGVAGHSHKHFPRYSPGNFFRLKIIQNVSAVTAACLLVRHEVYDEVGGLNETDLKVAFNDVDFCLKVREAGYRNVWTPFAQLYHLESVSRGAEDDPVKIARFQSEIAYMQRSWGPALTVDPFYSPNLTLDREDFSLAFPPRTEAAKASAPQTASVQAAAQ